MATRIQIPRPAIGWSGHTRPWGQSPTRNLKILSPAPGELTSCVPKASPFAGDHDDVIKEYEAALHLRPDEAELHEAIGEFYLDNRSDEDARSELEKAEALDPSRTKTLYLLGRLYVLDNENEKAVPVLERALQLQPNLNEANGLVRDGIYTHGKVCRSGAETREGGAVGSYG